MWQIYLIIFFINRLNTVSAARSDLQTRILRGDQVKPGEFPYLVSIRLVKGKESYLCGGSIINEDTVVTAAHCFYGKQNGSYITWVHPNYDNRNNKYGKKISGRAIIHENFDAVKKMNDIALVKLDLPLTLGGPIRSIRLAQRNYGPGTMVTVAGFGTTSRESLYVAALELRKHSMVLINDGQCKPSFKCSKPENGFTCYGDSGGPLVRKGATVDEDELVGVVSFGGSKCEGFTEHHSSIFHHRAWIQSKL